MAATSTTPAEDASKAIAKQRERWFRVVLLGLVVLIIGFTALLLGQAMYPCVPGAGSTVEPPLSECAVALSPWVGVALVGLILAVMGYIRVR